MGKAARLKRLRKLDATSQERLVRQVRESLPGHQIKILQTEQKMSEVIADFAGPWLDLAKTEEQHKHLLGLAILAWNSALLPEAQRWEGTDPKFIEALGEPGMRLVQEMIDRKLALCPDNKRSILDYEISGSGQDLRLNVVSSVTNPERYLGRAAETGGTQL
jgi:hypothetical protein